MIDITELWILKDSGLCLYHYAIKSDTDPSLFGGFITAINQFSESLSSKGIQTMRLGEALLLIIKDTELKILVVGKAKLTMNEKISHEIISDIYKMFLKTYSKYDIINWNGDLTIFESFTKKIESMFQDKTIKSKHMW